MTYFAVTGIAGPDDNMLVPADQPHSVIAVYRYASGGGLPIGHVATLQLPPGTWSSWILESWAPSPPKPPQSALFWPDPARRIVVLRLQINYTHPPESTFQRLRSGRLSALPSGDSRILLLVPRDTFREHINYENALNRPKYIPEVPWDQWGPRGSVLIKYDVYRAWRRWEDKFRWFFPFGSRLTFYAPSAAGTRLVTIDVNPLSRYHPSHAGCARKDKFAWIEDLSASGDPSLITTHPRSYYLRPAFPNAARLLYAVSEHSGGYTISVSGYAVRYGVKLKSYLSDS